MSHPQVSIGLPVYNGEKYLGECLDSLLRQTHEDFEIIISDNASTDSTERICRDFASKDQRVRYDRHATNLGAAANFNHVVKLARGRYFKWSAHDDLLRPEFVERCVEVLDRDPEVVLCYTRQIDIDDDGAELRRFQSPVNATYSEPHLRFAQILSHQTGAPIVWGLTRTQVLRLTPLIGSYYASDLVLLAELVLHGKFQEVPEELFVHRDHSERSVYTQSAQTYATWLNTSSRSTAFAPSLRMVAEYLRSAWRGPIGLGNKLRCSVHVAKWMKWNWFRVERDWHEFWRRRKVKSPDASSPGVS